jgi:hypothetical protein
VPFSAYPRSRKLSLLALLVLLSAGCAVGGAAVPARAVDDGSLGIRPAHESAFFHLDTLPGTTIRNTAIVSNHTNEPVTLLDYAVDAHGSATGTFAMAAQTDARRGVGGWVQLAARTITVPARTERRLPFGLHVPAGTAPGDYTGALIIQSPPVEGATSVHGGTAVRLNIIQRQGLRIYLHVDGAAVKALTAGALSSTSSGGGVDCAVPVYNTGNVTLHPSAQLTVTSQVGVNTRIRFSSVDSVLPGGRLTLRAHLDHPAPVQIGTAVATVSSEAGTRRVTADFVALPWTGIAAALAVLLLTAALAVTRAALGRRPHSGARRAIRGARGPSHAAPPIARARHRAELAT